MKNYIKIARIDHWFKQVFMLPGILLAIILTEIDFSPAMLWPILIGVLSTCFVASANYVINEWLDAEFDQHHPVKKYRPSVIGNLQAKYVYLEYVLFIAIGLGLASMLTREFQIFSVVLLMMGVLYNVKPFRTKDCVYLDVLSESLNNPLRLMLGWTAIASGFLPPSSILLAYWMGGAFLMAVKRYAEYRFINNPNQAGLYRCSFKFYTEKKLLLSAFFYALSSSFFLGIFLIKYKIEFLLSFPLFALLFVWYFAIGMKSNSPTQNPEKLYHEPIFLGYVLILGVIVWILFLIDIPWLQIFIQKLEY